MNQCYNWLKLYLQHFILKISIVFTKQKINLKKYTLNTLRQVVGPKSIACKSHVLLNEFWIASILFNHIKIRINFEGSRII